MQRVVLPDFDPYSLRDAVDTGTYARGAEYVRQRAVAEMWWDASDDTLNGLVRGSNGQLYSTAASFSRHDDAPLQFGQSECSCPVGYNCKHAVALVLTAATGSAHGLRRGPAAIAEKPRKPDWEASLDSLLAPDPASVFGQPGDTPLAIELSLARTARQPYARGQVTESAPRLLARLVYPGKRGGWVSGSLSWSKLDSLRYYGGATYPAEQVRVLQEIYALYRSGAQRLGYYSYGDEKSIELSAFDSRQLWPLLDQAQSAGICLVRAHKPGVMEKYGQAELCLDVAGDAATGGLTLTAMIQVGGQLLDAVPVAFIGTDGHGVVYADRSETRRSADPSRWSFRLARLAKSVPPQLQRMALAGQRLEVPVAEQIRFRDVYYPRLRRAATIISSDQAFAPPEISGPTLVLRACYGVDHRVDLDWEWAYQVGETRLRAAGQPGDDLEAYRDAEAEQVIVDGLDLSFDRFGLIRRGPADSALVSHVQLDGIETMRFTTELLPLICDQPGLVAEVSGDAADYREASDSLRIDVSANEVGGETDWFDLGITISVDGQQIPFTDVFLALSRGESHLLLPSGAYFSLQKPELQALGKLIDEARALQDAPASSLRISRFQAGLWDELTEFGVVSHQAAAWERQVAGLLSMNAVEPLEAPPTLAAQLRPYQLDGFGWLAFLWQHQLGGILADDMGLGKTLQSLALICHARAADPSSPPFLIVAPTSVVPNWSAEARRFAPDLKIVSITDTARRRGHDLRDTVAGADAIVTSYTLLRIDFAAYGDLAWSGLILDEAQFTKNHQSKIYQCARRLPAPFKIAITGTPMENNLMELWSLLSITAPGLFPNPTKFHDYYARPIERQDNPELLAQLRRRIKPLVKRRTKEQVAPELPAKQEQVLEVELHPRHRKVYQTHLQRERQKVLGLIHDMNANRFTILRSLTLLRQLSLHAGLVDDAHAELASSKIDVLLEQLGDVVGGGHRALVFSQFTGFLTKVRESLDLAGITYCYLDGRTKSRAEVIERFKSGAAPVFLISLKAGGFGLNLTEADYCFLLDPWWNPATEAQAVDRTHRIGQTRNVMVYRLIAKDTIEEKVMALKERKAELFASVMDNGNVFGGGLDAEDIRGLLA